MKTVMKKLTIAAFVASFGIATSAQAGYVDLFDDPLANNVNIATDNTVGGAVAFNEYPGGAIPSTSILGGYRDIISDLVASNGVGTPSAVSEVGGGGYSFSTSSGDTGIGSIQWDGQDNSASLNMIGLRNGGTTGLNLINQTGCPTGGCDRFEATVLVADQGFQYKIGAYTDAGNYSILTASSQFGIGSNVGDVPGPVTADYLFEWFGLGSGNYLIGGLNFNILRVGTVDFTNIGALEFIVNSNGGTAAVDLALDSITKTVPEPGSMALLGLGLLAAGALRRRRQA